MPTLQRMYELEQRLTRILIGLLLVSWTCGMLVVGEIASIYAENVLLARRVKVAEWYAKDQSIALHACYEKKKTFIRDNMTILDEEDKEN